MKKPHALSVTGRSHTWRFVVQLDPRHVEELREDGVEIMGAVAHRIPEWLPARLTVAWCFLQDVFHWRRPLT